MDIVTALKQSGCNRLDAEILLAKVLKKDRSYLCAHDRDSLTSLQQQQFQALVERRKHGEPVAYLTGHQEFWSLDLVVTPDVLIPRPETELLVETILQMLPAQEKLDIADLGTGSGAIALALATERPAWNIVATDFSAAALAVAQQNAQRLAVNNVEFLLSHWCEQLPIKKYSAIVSNPPYIDANDSHLPALRYEPQSALIAAEQGLADIEIIIQQAQNYLADHGMLIIEHGYQQADAVQTLFKKYNYTNSRTINDLAKLPRISCSQYNQSL